MISAILYAVRRRQARWSAYTNWELKVVCGAPPSAADEVQHQGARCMGPVRWPHQPSPNRKVTPAPTPMAQLALA